MDTVVLAGGRGSRLAGLVPEFHKPLITVNGKTLVAQAVDLALAAPTVNAVVVVVAPQNAEAVVHAVGGKSRVCYVIQPTPVGPGDALIRGLQACVSDRVMVLLADNLMTASDVNRVAENGRNHHVVGVKSVPTSEALRYTRVLPNATTREAEPLRDDELAQESSTVWIGPLVVDRAKTLEYVGAAANADGEKKIGPLIPYIAPDAKLVHVTCVDIGVPEVLTTL